MNEPITFYLHNNCEASEIRNILREQEVPNHLIESLTDEIYSRFYEIKFTIEYDADGKIGKIKLNEN